LVHDVLAEIDFGRPEDAAPLVRRFAPRHLPGVEDQWEAPIDMIRRFLGSPRGAEIKRARLLHRELEFLLAWPPGNSQPGARYLQGFIDCLYQDPNGRWILLDYKTNAVSAATIDAVAAEYEMQMLLYALAVEQILGAPPAELVLHFLRPGLEYGFGWDATARDRVVGLVNQALKLVSNTNKEVS
jgi:ATP-dependent helicase/nuclease subunit A